MKELLKKYGIKPSRKLGQNFLVNKGIVEKIIKAAEIKKKDIIIEIGPGLGVLTKELAKKAQKIIAIEKDSKLTILLNEELKEFNNIELVNEDILATSRVPSSGSYKVVANLPFNVASAIIRKFLEAANPPEEMILLVQKEVAQRICAKPPKMSILAISVQLYSEAKTLFRVSKGSFWPAPKVDAAILKLTPKPRNWLSQSEDWLSQLRRRERFFAIVKKGFSHPRKQLAGNLSKELKINKQESEEWLKKSGIDPKRRAETLSVEDWLKLTENLKSKS